MSFRAIPKPPTTPKAPRLQPTPTAWPLPARFGECRKNAGEWRSRSGKPDVGGCLPVRRAPAGYAGDARPPGAPGLGGKPASELFPSGRRSARSASRFASDSHDCDFAPRSPTQPFYVVRVACENRGSLAKSDRHHNGVDNVRRSRHSKQPPCLVRFALAKRNDHAPGQEAPELDLLWGPADLGDNRRRNEWNNVASAVGTAQEFHPSIPRAWSDSETTSFELPLAQTGRSPCIHRRKGTM